MGRQKENGRTKTDRRMENSVRLLLLFIPSKIDGYLNEHRLERNHRIEDRKISTFID